MKSQPTSSPRELEEAIRTYRIRSETGRELVREGERRRTAALEVRLWATLPRGAGRLPGEPACRAAERAALRVAEAALASEGRQPDGEIEPFRQALYDSRQFPGCDEVYVAIRLPLRFGEDGAEDEGREARLRALRRRLDLLGVFEGRWRPPPPPAEATEAWSVRPAAVAFGQPSPGPAPTRRAA